MHTPLPSREEIAKLPPDGGNEFNRLVHEKSPYLLQHARNPVDWYPWGPEAFNRARREDKSIFLSVGYSTCHWCHVMAEESFENEEVARILNEHFVCIKVDREERPDLDETYMNATHIFTGRGGWPNSVWLVPDGRPWYAGTYFPPEDRFGVPGFKTVLLQLARFWRERREDVQRQAAQFVETMRRMAAAPAAGEGQLSSDLAQSVLSELRDAFDERLGGFGPAPKFPPHTSLRLLFHLYPRTEDPSVLFMAESTLAHIMRGGIHDHVGGGFHRYSTDSRWFLPHFEKMLYDTAQLVRSYVEAWRITGHDAYRRTAEDAIAWVLREMTDPQGGFYAAVDADSEGEEGKFYVWTQQEILEVLGKTEGERFCRIFGVESNGNFVEEGTGRRQPLNILFLRDDAETLARAEGYGDDWRERLSEGLRLLRERREQRVHPHRDDKVLTDWNGLMIGALACAGRYFNERRYIEAAEKAADFILANLRQDGRLLHMWRQGEARRMAYLDDYAFLADGLLDLHDATGEKRWSEEARALMDTLEHYYRDPDFGVYFLTAEDDENPLVRSRSPYDQALPSGNGVAARALVRLALIDHRAAYMDTARRVLTGFLGAMQSSPRSTESLILATSMFLEASTTPAAKSGRTRSPVMVSAAEPVVEAKPGGVASVRIRLEVAPGYHINSHNPRQDYLVPTWINLRDSGDTVLGEVEYPGGREISLMGRREALSVYDGTIYLSVPLIVAETARPGEKPLIFEAHIQACNDRTCYAPETLEVPITLKVAEPVGK